MKFIIIVLAVYEEELANDTATNRDIVIIGLWSDLSCSKVSTYQGKTLFLCDGRGFTLASVQVASNQLMKTKTPN
jgi:hypothetical protein